MDIRVVIMSLLALATPVYAAAQGVEGLSERLLGGVETISEEEAEAFGRLRDSPLRVNHQDAAGLAASGLFTAYQAASIIDYRSLHGDILSAAELSMLDGFNPYFVSVVRRLLSFEETSAEAAASADISLRLWRKDGFMAWGGKVKISSGGFEAGLSARTLYSDGAVPSSYSFYVAVRHGRSRFVAGDVNLRFGQGLSLWSGASFGGVTTPVSLLKRASGLTPSNSYSASGQHRGFGWEYRPGRRHIITAFSVFPGLREWFQEGRRFDPALLSGVNYTLLLPHGQVGVTALAKTNTLHNTSFSLEGASFSLDGRFCYRGTDFFFEVSAEPSAPSGLPGGAAVFGSMFPALGGRIGLSARCFSRSYRGVEARPLGVWSSHAGEMGLSVSYGWGQSYFCVDAASQGGSGKKYFKAKYLGGFSMGAVSLRPLLLLRLKNYGADLTRRELRLDASLPLGSFVLSARVDAVKCVNLGTLAFVEGGYKCYSLSLWLRGTVFRADNWYDRLYCYERDAPGNFLVPFYYGRGYALAFYSSWSPPGSSGRAAGRLKLYLRASYSGFFPSSMRKKPGSAELRLCARYSF